MLYWIRRGHLYLGLFLFPWAVLYGVTAFLFNHPSVASDQPVLHFNEDDLKGTPLEQSPSVDEIADEVIARLNEVQQPAEPYSRLDGSARYSGRDNFIAMVQASGRTFSIMYEPQAQSGMIRETTSASAAPAPFAVGQPETRRGRGGMMGPMRPQAGGIELPNSLTSRLKATVPSLLERNGLPSGEVTITQSPDIKFHMLADKKAWTVTYNPLTTAVTGGEGTDRSDLSWRSFLTRLHLTRGYPGEVNAKWLWAVGVDAMAVVMCFWGCSGLLMWWQIKSTRKWGFAVLALSTVVASALGFAMHGIWS